MKARAYSRQQQHPETITMTTFHLWLTSLLGQNAFLNPYSHISIVDKPEETVL